jgi:hypothetical protein
LYRSTSNTRMRALMKMASSTTKKRTKWTSKARCIRWLCSTY